MLQGSVVSNTVTTCYSLIMEQWINKDKIGSFIWSFFFFFFLTDHNKFCQIIVNILQDFFCIWTFPDIDIYLCNWGCLNYICLIWILNKRKIRPVVRIKMCISLSRQSWKRGLKNNHKSNSYYHFKVGMSMWNFKNAESWQRLTCESCAVSLAWCFPGRC